MKLWTGLCVTESNLVDSINIDSGKEIKQLIFFNISLKF